MLHIVIPLAGKGAAFKEAGYTFPKPLIDIHGKTMIELVVHNLRPKTPHRFIFICQREQYEKYDLHNVFKNASKDQFDVVLVGGLTEGALCTTMLASRYINNKSELLIANADQYIETSIDTFIATARKKTYDGLILTFQASHPKWSYARTSANGEVLEVAEKVVISKHATAGLYYFKKGSDFMKGAEQLIHKNIRHNNEFYVCPVYNELLLTDKKIFIYEIPAAKMYSLGVPEDVALFLKKIETKRITI